MIDKKSNLTNPNSCDMVKIETLTEREMKLILKLRTIPHGKIEIFKADGEPIRIVRIEESVKL